MIFGAFSQYLNLKFNDKAQGVVVYIYERPGRWMNDVQLTELVDKMRSLVKVSIKDESLDYGALTGERSILENVLVTLIVDRKTQRTLAFNCLTFMPCELAGVKEDVLHLGLIIVHPDIRHSGFSWILYGLTTSLIFIRHRLRPIWISNVTQVPSIIGKVSETFSSVYPDPVTNRRKSFKQLVLVRQIMLKYRHVFGVGPEAQFNEDKFVIENSYTGGSDHLKKTVDEAPKHRNPVFNDYCAQYLDYERGDDFLQIGQIDLDAIHRFLTRDIPARSLLGVISIYVLMALQSIALPILSWFDDSKHQGMIRPWRTQK
tara:strand:- start:15746 stop:16693 length:948 start_codon:yes stop_codon:yes gene_type:complete